MEIRPFHAFRTWKVHVVIFSFHATHFHTLHTTLHFRYVNARFDIQYTMLLIFTRLSTLHFRYVNARFDFRCVELWYCSQSPNFGCLCVRIGSEVYSIVTYSLSGNSIVTTLLTRSSHKNVSIKKSKMVFPFG